MLQRECCSVMIIHNHVVAIFEIVEVHNSFVKL